MADREGQRDLVGLEAERALWLYMYANHRGPAWCLSKYVVQIVLA